VAVDGNGNVYVAENANNYIRKITPAGVVTTLAGNPKLRGGFANRPGRAARFNFPTGVAVDANGNVYVADEGNEAVREITPNGVVTSLPGSGRSPGDSHGVYNNPTGVAVDGNGNVYVADTSNHCIRKIAPGGRVSLVAGNPHADGATRDGPVGTAPGGALFDEPTGVAVDGSGNVYVVDNHDDVIRKISGGVVTTLAGKLNVQGHIDATGTAAEFAQPYGLAVDGSGYVYVADGLNQAIRKITPDGAVTTLAGAENGDDGSTDGTGSKALLDAPIGVASDPGGTIYVADSYNNAIRTGRLRP
jgi:streptogramin lyase